MLAERLKAQGVFLAANNDELTVETAAPLTDNQRDYIRGHKSQLLAELEEVKSKSITRLKKIAEERSHPLDDLLRWYKDDLDDLAAMSDKDFRFVVSEYLDNLDRYSPVNRPHCVRCIDCKHFTRTDHPHIGKCAAGVNQSAPAGFWDSHLRGCDKYTEATE